jgi:ABC-2 type transport system ATP-binding protein
VPLCPSLTGGEAIDLLGRLRGRADERRRDELVERFHLDPREEGPHLLQGRPPEGRPDRRAEPTSVLLSSHILAEAEALCERVSIIRDGRIVEAGTLADLRHLTRM